MFNIKNIIRPCSIQQIIASFGNTCASHPKRKCRIVSRLIEGDGSGINYQHPEGMEDEKYLFALFKGGMYNYLPNGKWGKSILKFYS